MAHRTQAILVHQPGGPEVLRLEEVELPPPGPGEVLLRQTAVAVNFKDVYQRSGLYPMQMPFVAGSEAAGVVEEVGPGAEWLPVGTRVAYANIDGAYAGRRLVPADQLVPLPDAIEDTVAASVMTKGMTAQYLIRRTFPVQRGQTVLFHAAAGGVGLFACQWLAAIGAIVIGTVGSKEKAVLARGNGCRHVIDYSREDFVARVKEITHGEGVDVVYDSVGKDTFPGSLDVLRPRGMWVSFGQSSGPVPPFTTSLLLQKGSLFVTRPTIAHYVARREELEATAAETFEVIRSGLVRVHVNQTFPLSEAAEAHRALEGRRTTGATVLIP